MDSVRITRKIAYSADVQHLQETIQTAREQGAPMESCSAGTAAGR